MKKLTVVMLVLLVAGTAFAGKTGKPMGPLNLYVYEAGYGQPAGTGLLQNDGDVAFSFDGYTILSDSSLIDVTSTVSSMFGPLTLPLGVKDNAYLDNMNFPGKVGLTFIECGDWVEMNPTADNYSDVTPTAGMLATLQPGDSINLGAAFLGLNQADGTLTYVNSIAGDSMEGQIIVVPEPATMGLLALVDAA